MVGANAVVVRDVPAFTVVAGNPAVVVRRHDGDAWQSPGYTTAMNHADLAISTTLGSVELNPAGGCE